VSIPIILPVSQVEQLSTVVYVPYVPLQMSVTPVHRPAAWSSRPELLATLLLTVAELSAVGGEPCYSSISAYWKCVGRYFLRLYTDDKRVYLDVTTTRTDLNYDWVREQVKEEAAKRRCRTSDEVEAAYIGEFNFLPVSWTHGHTVEKQHAFVQLAGAIARYLSSIP
jgi:hypothetical protein